MVVDQFAEIFTLCDDDQVRQAYIDEFLRLIQAPGPRHSVILTMRSDFESYVARLPKLQALFGQAQLRVMPLNATELREAIEQPAERDPPAQVALQPLVHQGHQERVAAEVEEAVVVPDPRHVEHVAKLDRR